MRHLHTPVVVVALLGALAVSCSSDDGEDVDAGSGGPPETDPGPGAEPSSGQGADDPLPPELSGALLDAGDVPGWETWRDETAPGWRAQVTPSCEGEGADRARCEEVATAVGRAEGGAVSSLTPYPVGDDGVPRLPASAAPVGVNQLVVAFPDDDAARAVVDAGSEPYRATSGSDLSGAQPVDGLGDGAWQWELQLDPDRWDVDPDQELAGRLVIFRRGRVVVQLLHTWVEGEEHPDTIQLGSLVDDRLAAAED